MSKVSTITIYVNLDCTNVKFYWFRGFLFLSAIQNVNTPNEVKIAKTLTFNFRYDQQSCLETLICLRTWTISFVFSISINASQAILW